MSIKTETAGGIARIEIARPEKKNALTVAMLQHWPIALTVANADAQVRAIVLHGQPEIFTAGNDLEDFMAQAVATRAWMRRFQVHARPERCEKPVVAAVTGAAVGIGTTMLMHCDLVYCGDNAMFSMPFVSLDCARNLRRACSCRSPRGIPNGGKAAAFRAHQRRRAVEMHIVNRILPPNEVLPYAKRQATRFTQLPPTSCARQTLAARRLASCGREDDGDETQSFGRLLASPEAKSVRRVLRTPQARLFAFC